MNPQTLDLEAKRAEVKYFRYKAFQENPDWKHFVEDMQEQMKMHEKVCIASLQNGLIEDAKKQAFIVMGIEESLDRPSYIVKYHDLVIRQTLKQKICTACGNFIRWANKSENVKAA